MVKCERCGFEGDNSQIKKSPNSFPVWYGKPICKKCYVELKEKTLKGQGNVESKFRETEDSTKLVPDKNLQTTNKKIKWGWMGLFIVILVVISPLIAIYTIYSNLDYFLTSDLFDSYPGLFFITIFVVVITIFLMLFGIYVGLSIYMLKERALFKAKIFLIVNLIFSILSPFLIFFAGLPEYVISFLGYAIVPTILRSLIPFLIWYWFVSSSKTAIRIVSEAPHIY
jgi:hypothetical protein